MKTVNEGNKGQSVTKNVFYVFSLLFMFPVFFFLFFSFSLILKLKAEERESKLTSTEWKKMENMGAREVKPFQMSVNISYKVQTTAQG